MNYINILLAKINHFNSKIADSNYSDIRSLYHSNYSSTKYHIRFSPTSNRAETNTQFAQIFARLHKYSNTKRVFGYTFI